jgi:hypothetical protein
MLAHLFNSRSHLVAQRSEFRNIFWVSPSGPRWETEIGNGALWCKNVCSESLRNPFVEEKMVLKRTESFSRVPVEPETKNNYTGEGQQQFTSLLLRLDVLL